MSTRRLWDATVATHRREVRDAVLDSAAALVEEHGLRGVTMSQVSADAGIARATLYKYFADVEAILVAWHQRQVAAHLAQLEEIAERPADAASRLAAVLEAYSLIQHEHPGGELAAALHRRPHVARARRHLTRFVRALLVEAAADGAIRRDTSADELAEFCLHALDAARALSSKAAVRRLVAVVLAGLR